MTTRAAGTHGVYFDRRDLAGFRRRLAADAVDATTMMLTWVVVSVVWSLAQPDPFTAGSTPPGWALALLAYLYLVPVKSSRLRTVGYRVAGIKVVDLWGLKRSLGNMTLRSLPWVFHTMDILLIDVLWIFSNLDRRKLGDMLAGTLVVRSRGVPAGTGRVVLSRFDLQGFFLVFREVARPT